MDIYLLPNKKEKWYTIQQLIELIPEDKKSNVIGILIRNDMSFIIE